MRITHIIKTDGIAGAEAHLLVLLPALRQRGYDIRVIFIAPSGGRGADFAAALEALGVPVERTPIQRHGSPGLMWTLARMLRRDPPDIAHVHLFHAELWGIPAARLARVARVIDSRHNDDPRRARFPLKQIYHRWWGSPCGTASPKRCGGCAGRRRGARRCVCPHGCPRVSLRKARARDAPPAARPVADAAVRAGVRC